MLISVTKFLAAIVTGSSAMVSEGIHSLVDTGNQFLLLYGLHRSQRAPTTEHPFGHGKEAFFWSLIVAIVLFSLGAGFSIYEGIIHWQHPRELSHPYINYVVLGFAVLFELGPWWLAFRSMHHNPEEDTLLESIQDSKDPTILAVFFEDSAAIIGIMIAFFGILASELTSNPTFDAVASILIGGLLASVAIWLAYESKGLLIGEQADPELVADVRLMLHSDPRVCGVLDLLTMHIGPQDILLNAHVDFDDKISGNALEQAVSELEQHIRERYPQIRYLYISPKDRDE
jgi:cation diffusion facilitator family transporter